MICFKKLPDVILTRLSQGLIVDQILVTSFRREGKRWCIWRREYILLRDDGSCAGDMGFPTIWEEI